MTRAPAPFWVRVAVLRFRRTHPERSVGGVAVDSGALFGPSCGRMNPRERVRIVTETARAVLEGRLDAAAGAQALQLQEEQVAPHLRGDRIDVTQREAESVALELRLLAEQVSEVRDEDQDRDALVEMARILGQLAQVLR